MERSSPVGRAINEIRLLRRSPGSGVHPRRDVLLPLLLATPANGDNPALAPFLRASKHGPIENLREPDNPPDRQRFGCCADWLAPSRVDIHTRPTPWRSPCARVSRVRSSGATDRQRWMCRRRHRTVTHWNLGRRTSPTESLYRVTSIAARSPSGVRFGLCSGSADARSERHGPSSQKFDHAQSSLRHASRVTSR